MKKITLILISLIMVIWLSGCEITIKPDYDEDNQTLTFVEAKFYDYFDDKECVGLIFDYTNNSGENKYPSANFTIGVCQKGKVLDTLWVTEVDGVVGAAASVPTDTTARVVYLYVLRDNSSLSVEISDGQKFTINYEQIVKM